MNAKHCTVAPQTDLSLPIRFQFQFKELYWHSKHVAIDKASAVQKNE